MATGTFGNIGEFNSDAESVAAYTERVDLYLAANDVPSEKHVPVFLSMVGGKAYELLRSFCAPVKPQDRSYEELKDLMKGHFEPKPLVIAERYHFHRRDQAAGESIAEYMAELRRLSRTCEFAEEYLSEALRDRLVCGLRSENIQKRLLTETDLTLKRAVQVAQAMEAAEKNAKSLKGGEVTLQKLSYENVKQQPADATPCYRCGGRNHQPQECRFREVQCRNCGRRGHIARACRRRKSPSGKQEWSRRRPRQFIDRQNWTEATDDSDSDELQLNQIYLMESGSSQPTRVELVINDSLWIWSWTQEQLFL